jgi:hypothetical protein
MVVSFPAKESVRQKILAVVHVDKHRPDSKRARRRQPLDRRVRQGNLGADVDQHQPQRERTVDGEFSAGGAAHLFLFWPKRAVSRTVPAGEIALRIVRLA